jgi:hypothetical protein
LVGAVSVVAVGAVAVGGILAARRSPQDISKNPAAAPLREASTTPPASQPVSSVEVTVDLTKLAKGRAPQTTYLSGRTVMGGGYDSLTVPGKTEILRVARYGTEAWAVVLKDSGFGTNLVRIPEPGTGQKPAVVPDGASIATAADGLAAVYATEPSKFGGARIQGGKVVFEDGQPAGRKVELDRPADWGVQVLALAGETVFFQSSPTFIGTRTNLYSWNVESGKVALVKGVERRSQVNQAGTAAATYEPAGNGSCSAYVELATGLRKWRTCEYRLSNFADSDAFTPGGATVIYGPPKSDANGDRFVAAAEAASGKVTRQWTGATFLGSTAEDDDHLLIRAGTGGRSAIIRCSITRTTCELATPLARTDLLLGS